MTALLTTSAPQGLTRNELVLLAAAYSELLAAARASVASAELGEADPIGYIRDYLAEHYQLPPLGARPVVLLAQAAVPSTHRAGVA